MRSKMKSFGYLLALLVMVMPHTHGRRRDRVVIKGTTIDPHLIIKRDKHALQCPESHPYAFNNYKKCCAIGTRSHNCPTPTDPNELRLLASDPDECCEPANTIICRSRTHCTGLLGTIDKKFGKCPQDYPYAFDLGQKCCSSGLQSNNCSPTSGTALLNFEDSVDCCATTSITCQDQNKRPFICHDNEIAGCSKQNQCLLGDFCAIHAHCGGAPELSCSSNICQECKSVNLCNAGDTCSSSNECGGTPGLVCSSSNKCTDCAAANLCQAGDVCSSDDDCGGSQALICLSNICKALLSSTKLMIVGSTIAPGLNNAAIVDLKDTPTKCTIGFSQPGYGSVGTYMGDKALVCGGYNGFTDCYEYRSVDGWNLHTIGLKGSRVYSAAIWIDNERWWITGGSIPLTNSTEIYDNTTNSTVPFLDLPVANYNHNLVRLNNTHIIMLGARVPTKDTYLFNLITHEWTTGPQTLMERNGPSAGLVRFKNGTEVIALIGGVLMNSVEFLNTTDLTWRLGPQIPITAVVFGRVIQLEDTILLVGGTGNGYKILMFDIGQEEWIQLSISLPFESVHSACFDVPHDFVMCP